jgi:hypothetical protein
VCAVRNICSPIQRDILRRRSLQRCVVPKARSLGARPALWLTERAWAGHVPPRGMWGADNVDEEVKVSI